jgi:hypothetical protein
MSDYFEVFTKVSDDKKGFETTSPQFKTFKGFGLTPQISIAGWAKGLEDYQKEYENKAPGIFAQRKIYIL